MQEKQRPVGHHRGRPNLVIVTEFDSQDDAPNTVPFMQEHLPQEYANEYIQGLSPDYQPRNYINQSIVEPLQQPEQLMRRRHPEQIDLQVLQSQAIGLQTLNIFQKLWKRRMFIECFNAIRLAKNYGLSRQRSQAQLRANRHSSSLLQPARAGRWALQDRSVHRMGTTIDHDSSIQRARLLNQIADKLSQRSSRQVIIVEQPPADSSEVQIHQRVVESKLDRLEKMMRDIKRINEASNVGSTVYSITRPQKKKVRKEPQERETRRDKDRQYWARERSFREEEQQQQIEILSRDVYALKQEVRQIRESSRRSSREQNPNPMFGPTTLFERKDPSPYGNRNMMHSRSQYATANNPSQPLRFEQKRKGHSAIPGNQSTGYNTQSVGQINQVRQIHIEPQAPFRRDTDYVYQNKPITSPPSYLTKTQACPRCGCGSNEEASKKVQ